MRAADWRRDERQRWLCTSLRVDKLAEIKTYDAMRGIQAEFKLEKMNLKKLKKDASKALFKKRIGGVTWVGAKKLSAMAGQMHRLVDGDLPMIASS